jgi:DNA recombination protein RmuC
MTLALAALASLAVGFAAAWLLRTRALAAERAERIRVETRLDETLRGQERLQDTFKALAGDVLRSNSDAFLQLAEQKLQVHVGDVEHRKKAVEELVKPIQDSLKVYQEKADLLERERLKAYGDLSQQLQGVAAASEKLKLETGNLASALRQPYARGKWGELTLRRVVELSGLSSYCDFTEQRAVEGEEGVQRPDLVVHLPNRRQVVIDAKAVLTGYLDAMEATTDEARAKALKAHAVNLRDRVLTLSSKRYWAPFENSAEFVVLFVPGEAFLAAGIQNDPGLLEEAFAKRVVIATPTTLFALLKAVAYGWRQEQMAQNAREVADLGKKLYEAVEVWSRHLSKLRGAIFDTVEQFNAAQASLQTTVLPKARQMKDLGLQSDKELAAIEPGDPPRRPGDPPPQG